MTLAPAHHMFFFSGTQCSMLGMVPNPYHVVSQCSLMPGCRVVLRRSAPTYGKRQRIRGGAPRLCAIQIHVYFTLLYFTLLWYIAAAAAGEVLTLVACICLFVTLLPGLQESGQDYYYEAFSSLQIGDDNRITTLNVTANRSEMHAHHGRNVTKIVRDFMLQRQSIRQHRAMSSHLSIATGANMSCFALLVCYNYCQLCKAGHIVSALTLQSSKVSIVPHRII